jgi:hypothetical protein
MDAFCDDKANETMSETSLHVSFTCRLRALSKFEFQIWCSTTRALVSMFEAVCREYRIAQSPQAVMGNREEVQRYIGTIA